ncbi:MAG TPA: leucyl aminopeptidase [Gemmatimonadales bacterium]|nr:leucyl aminopeptidase [Gemmatimonadales bacterium]
MKHTLLASALEAADLPLLAVAVPKHDKTLPAALAALDARTGGLLGRAAGADFTGARDETSLLYVPPPGGQRRVLLVGVGKLEELPLVGGLTRPVAVRNAVRRAAAVAARRARALGTGAVAFAMPAALRPGVGAADFAQAALEGLAQGAWQFDELRAPGNDRRAPVAEVTVVVDAAEQPDAQRGFAVGQAMAEAQALARRLQVLPPNTCTPALLAETAQQLGAAHGFRVTVLEREQMRQEGMGALLAVAQGSATEPRFIVLEYKGAGDAAPVALVGKGITFDTGGISIKPAAQMEEMKYDMSGAAAVLGAFEALGRLKPALNVVGVIPSADNMPGGSAIRPSDVVKSHAGKHIEIVNTDAEGRLILADALSWVRRFKPAAVLDAATLTGAVVIALGHTASAVMGTDEALLEEVRRAGDRAGERVWPLPMYDEYRDQNKSDIADVKNSGGRPAGTITAGWFLREFAEGYPWVHIDVAGTAYSDADAPPLPKGPSGVPTRLFVEFLLGRAG